MLSSARHVAAAIHRQADTQSGKGASHMTTQSTGDPQVTQAMDDPQVKLALEGGAAESAVAASDDDDKCACTLFAVVNPNGTIARGLGAVSAQRFAPGVYEVIFNRNVSRCAYVATI